MTACAARATTTTPGDPWTAGMEAAFIPLYNEAARGTRPITNGEVVAAGLIIAGETAPLASAGARVLSRGGRVGRFLADESGSAGGILLSNARFGHTFRDHGSGATEFLTHRAAGSGMPQGQFLDDQAAARFTLDNLHTTSQGAVSLPVPEGLPVRVIMPDGSFTTASTIRLVPGGRGVKTAYPEP